MADLVPGDGADLVERRILHGNVGDRDARSASDAAGIGGEVVRLARAIVHEHPVGGRRRVPPSGRPRRAPCPGGTGSYLLNNGSIRIGESRIMKASATAVSATRPEPPALPGAAHQPVDADQRNGRDDRADHDCQRDLAEAIAERLARAAVGLLAPPARVDRPRQRQQSRMTRKTKVTTNARRLRRRRRPWLRPVENTGADDQPGDQRAARASPQQHPFLAHRIVVRFLERRRSQAVDVARGGRVHSNACNFPPSTAQPSGWPRYARERLQAAGDCRQMDKHVDARADGSAARGRAAGRAKAGSMSPSGTAFAALRGATATR